MESIKSLTQKIQTLEEKLSRLEKDYTYLYNYLDQHSEKVNILSKYENGIYSEICRQGEVAVKYEETRGWKNEDWSIGYTLKRKLRD